MRKHRQAPAVSIRWQPGTGPDQEALARMAMSARKPKKVMGEAWFMSEDRAMFDYLGITPVENLSDQQLKKVMWEIASGTRNFGHMDEWDDWFAYLLPQLILVKQATAHRGVIELVATAFFSLHPERDDHTDYNGVLQTLGQVIMAPSRWEEGRLILDQGVNGPPAGHWATPGWWHVGSDLSVSLFFCMKYLHPKHVREWLESVFEIADPHWRAQVLLWLGATRQVWDAGSIFPAGLGSLPDATWESSYLLDDLLPAPFIGEENRNAFKDALRPLLALHKNGWLASIAQVDYLELEALPYIVAVDVLYPEGQSCAAVLILP